MTATPMREIPRGWRLPAYGKALLAQRRAGVHPASVRLVFGDDWRGVAAPRVCVKPGEYRPGVFDWGMLSGLEVRVVVRTDACIGALLAELTRLGAVVFIAASDNEALLPAPSYAWDCREFDAEQRAMRWPAWWSDALNDEQNRLYDAWLDSAVREIKQWKAAERDARQ